MLISGIMPQYVPLSSSLYIDDFLKSRIQLALWI